MMGAVAPWLLGEADNFSVWRWGNRKNLVCFAVFFRASICVLAHGEVFSGARLLCITAWYVAYLPAVLKLNNQNILLALPAAVYSSFSKAFNSIFSPSRFVRKLFLHGMHYKP